MTKTELFIEKAIKKHGRDKYTYDKVEYVNARTKVKIYCNKHLKYFEQTASNHLSGSGCPECGWEVVDSSKRLNTDKFIEKSVKKHGKTYDYGLVKYVSSYENIDIICRTHGVFKQTPNNHMAGKGCPRCGIKKSVATRHNITTEDFVKRCNEKHNSFYNYSKTMYTKSNDKVTVICPIHGDFKIKASHHSSGVGCKQCGKIKSDKAKHLSLDDFIRKSKEVHGDDTYEYGKSKYRGSDKNIDIICKQHGKFSVVATRHLGGQGCPKCNANISKSEKEVLEFLSEYVEVEGNDKSIIKPFEIDIIINKPKIAIEFNGLYWHSDKFVDDKYHLNKTEMCNKEGYKLIHIFSDEWEKKKDIVKSILLNKIGKTPNKIYARETKVVELNDNKLIRDFLNDNHIQGFVGSKIKLGLIYKDEIVSIMTFGDLRKNLGSSKKEGSFEIMRFCNKINTTVVGGASKLFKHFIKNYSPKSIVSYADRRYSEGNLYENLGMKLVSISKPNYYYVNNGFDRENRFKYRKSELVKLGYDKNKSERTIMKELGYYRVYDCGTLKYEMLIDN